MGNILPEMGKSAVKRRKPRSRPADRLAFVQPTSIADALFSSTQQRVLGLLFGQSERSFFASELIELAGSGSGAVQRELERLVESGLVTRQTIGRQRHFQANADSPVFDALRTIVLRTSGFVEPLRSALAPLANRIRFATLYGSTAKGAATSRSDIDVLIVGDGLFLEEVYAALSPAEKMFARRISPTLYTSGEFQKRRRNGNAFLKKVLAGTNLPLIGHVDAVATSLVSRRSALAWLSV
jgi:predicted nucleotidyltransferase